MLAVILCLIRIGGESSMLLIYVVELSIDSLVVNSEVSSYNNGHISDLVYLTGSFPKNHLDSLGGTLLELICLVS